MASWFVERLPHSKQLLVYLPREPARSDATVEKPPIQVSNGRLMFAPPPPTPLAMIDLKPLVTGAGNAPDPKALATAQPSFVSGSDHWLVKVPLLASFAQGKHARPLHSDRRAGLILLVIPT